MPMPRITLADHTVFHDLAGGQQNDGAMPFIVVREGATTTRLKETLI